MSTDWYQTMLTPPDVLEANLRVGVIASANHCQVMVELKDPVSKVQIAAWSSPHANWDSWPHLLDLAVAKLREQLGAALEPF